MMKDKLSYQNSPRCPLGVWYACSSGSDPLPEFKVLTALLDRDFLAPLYSTTCGSISHRELDTCPYEQHIFLNIIPASHPGSDRTFVLFFKPAFSSNW